MWMQNPNPMKNSLQPGKTEVSRFSVCLVDAWKVFYLTSRYLKPKIKSTDRNSSVHPMYCCSRGRLTTQKTRSCVSAVLRNLEFVVEAPSLSLVTAVTRMPSGLSHCEGGKVQTGVCVCQHEQHE